MKNPKKPRRTQRSVAEGEWLIAAMDRAGMNNIQLADKLDMETPNLVSQWRKGDCNIPDLQMFRLANALKVDAIVMRPSLLAYVDAVGQGSILDGLSDAAKEQVMGFIALLRSTGLQTAQARHESGQSNNHGRRGTDGNTDRSAANT